MAGCIWDSANKSANLSLGRMSVSAYTTAAAATWKGVRATTSQSSGKKYLEYNPGYSKNNGLILGFGNASFNTASYPGSDGNSFGEQSQGSGQGVSNWNITLSNMGEVVQCAIDLTNKLVWMRTDRNANWNNSGTADPATGAGGFSYTVAGALFPAIGLFDAVGQNFVYINAGAFSFVGTAPSGFSAWDSTAITGTGVSSTPTTWDSGTKNANVALSGGNLVATQNSASSTWGDVRATSSRNSGQVYFECTETAYDGGNGIFIGLGDSSTGTANGVFPGSDGSGHSTGFHMGSADCYFGNLGNSGQPGGPAGATGHVIGVACDLNRGLMWCKDITAAGSWNADATADPATGRRGAAIPPQDQYIFFAGFRSGGSSDAVTLNTGGTAFTGTLPSGYTKWDASAAAGSVAGDAAVCVISG